MHRVDDRLIGLVTDTCPELFGSGRCMWGSNFPLESLWTDFTSLAAAWRGALAAHGEAVSSDVMAGTARRVYRL